MPADLGARRAFALELPDGLENVGALRASLARNAVISNRRSTASSWRVEPTLPEIHDNAVEFTPSGIGLDIVLDIVHRLLGLLGGRVEIESEPGSGSTFRIWLPAMPPSPS
jgi:hypothetical protein